VNKMHLVSCVGLAGIAVAIVAQPVRADVVKVTSVEIQPTASGTEIVLKTTSNESLQVFTSSFGKTFVANVVNTQLQISDRNNLRQINPVKGIAAVTVSETGANSLRVVVTGETELPKVRVRQSENGLVLSATTSTTAATQPPAAPAAPPASETQPQVTTPQSEVPPTEGEVQQLTTQRDEESEIVVTGERETGYRVPNSTTATKTDTPIRDVPGNIQVIPREVIEDQGAVRINDVLRNVSGVNFSTDAGGRSPTYNVRGFEAIQFKNGLREDRQFNTRTYPETANIEQIEVLKGPASVLFGQAQPGGIINFTTKRPLPEPFYQIDFTAGSYDFYRPTLDFSGPLNSDGTLAYRLNAAYEHAESFRDFVSTERYFIAPVVSWRISPNTSLTFEGEYLRDRRPIDRGLVAVGDEVADIPLSRFLGDPSYEQEMDEFRTYLYLDHRFSENLSLRTALRYTSSKEIYNSVEANELEADDRTLLLARYFGGQYYETYTLQNDLTWKFNTGAIAHTLLFGVELARQTGRYFEDATAAESPSIDIFDPDYESVFDFPFSLEPDPAYNGGKLSSDTIAFYLQDQIAFTDNLKLVLGGRFDSFDSEERYPGDPTLNVDTEASEFSPRVGIVYQPIQPISLYANYSRAFIPQTGRLTGGGAVEPEIGEQYEVGVKGEFLDGRLASTLAFYDITKSNVLTDDANNPDPDFSIQVGEQQSKGFEFDVSGEILPGWNVIASYAYTDAEISADNTYAVGNRLNNVPFNTASLWTKYTIQSGSLAGLGFGAGIFYVDSRAGDLDNSFTVPDFTRVDAAIYYERDNFKAALNFKNLFDVEYFEGVQSRTQAIPGAPFTVQGTVSWQF
jgi:iron complex outermembrane recepter protein